MSTETDVTTWDTRLGDVLAGRGVASLFQPIVDLTRGTVVGYEALSRFEHPAGRPPPDAWFRAAAERGLAPELDVIALRSALSSRADLPPDCFLSVNLEPESLLSGPVRAELDAAGDLSGLVVEITEHRPVALAELEPACDWLRGAGALIAVDDAGAGYAGLQAILSLRPSLLKLDRSLVAGIDTDEAKAALVEMMGVFASRLDAWILGEGVETEGEARRLVDLGVPLAQGFYFGRPAPPWSSIDPVARSTMGDQRPGGPAELGSMLVIAPAVDEGAPPTDCFVEGIPWVVVVDQHQRPLGVVTAASWLGGELLPALRVSVDSSASELAHRLSTGCGDPSLPAMVTDAAGAYLGIVTLRRLLTHLATAAS